jgi:hypothetical protein
MNETIAIAPLIPTVRYKSFSPAGDLIAALPGMRQIWLETGKKAVIQGRLNVLGHYYDGAIHATHDENGQAVCMSRKHWDMLVPLLEAQEYVHKCEIWEGQDFDFDLDRIREYGGTPMPHGHLYWWQPLVYPQLAADFSQKFLSVAGRFAVRMVQHGKHTDSVTFSGDYVNILRDKILITRSERYINQYVTYHFLKDYESKVVFAGTEKEYERFCNEWNLKIPYLEVKNYLELAQSIARCGLYISNQTMGAHIANGLAKRRLIEVSPNVANTWPTTKHGYPFMHQVSLEYYVKKFMSE